MLDIRIYKEVYNKVQLADINGSLGKVVYLERLVPEQLDLLNFIGEKLGHIKFADIDNLIKALNYAKDHWEEE